MLQTRPVDYQRHRRAVIDIVNSTLNTLTLTNHATLLPLPLIIIPTIRLLLLLILALLLRSLGELRLVIHIHLWRCHCRGCGSSGVSGRGQHNGTSRPAQGIDGECVVGIVVGVVRVAQGVEGVCCCERGDVGEGVSSNHGLLYRGEKI